MRLRRSVSLVFLVVILGTLSTVAAQFLARVEIPIYPLGVDVDTRPDLPGIQYSMSALKRVPIYIRTIVGNHAAQKTPTLPAGTMVRASLSGPSFTEADAQLTAIPGGMFELPTLSIPGEYRLTDIRLVAADGSILSSRSLILDIVSITVIDELLVTSVSSRPLTADEINERGISIDEDNFTTLSFAIGMLVASEPVEIEVPIAFPTGQSAADEGGGGAEILDTSSFERLGIPNLSVSGFSLSRPVDQDGGGGSGSNVINGLMIIPGNIAFLNQFFSVLVVATNIAPDGSGIFLENTQATIALPFGDDAIYDGGEGDDPLRVAETDPQGIQTTLALLADDGEDNLRPQQSVAAEFLVEGLREGTHVVQFEIQGDLVTPGFEQATPLLGVATGVVQVRNPTFAISLSHPEVVRQAESYRLFAVVTNTSTSPANYFRLSLDANGLMGARLADGEIPSRETDVLLPGQSIALDFAMIAETTGEVRATVFLADPGISGSFLLRTGVGDTGIPLSPDTLILPRIVDELPSEPDIAFAATRLLGQAYSVATAPAGTLPPGV